MTPRPWTVVAAAGFAVLAAAVAADPPAVPGSVRDAVYFGPAGPVRLRFHVTVGGRPVDAMWADAIDALFTFCDRNGDGVLDETERAVFAPPRRGRNEVVVSDEMAAAPSLELKFDRKDDTVTRAAFAAAMRAAGYGPIRLTMTAGQADSQQLSAALFKHLDRDGDGKLSPDELRSARERLAVLDVNEDELLSAAELLGRLVTANAGRPASSDEEPATSSPDLVFLATEEREAVKQLLAARGTGRAVSLSRAEFGADAATFAALDKDKNGRLDAAELADWLQRPADVDVALAFGPAGERLNLTVRPPTRAEPDGGLLTLPGTWFRFEPPSDLAAGVAARLRGQFQQIAKTRPVDRPAQLALFDFADRNGDGKLDAAEVEAALTVLVPLAACRVEVTFVDQGNGLFELLDRNGDGQLSPRELVEAVAVLKPFADATGAVEPKDLPRRFPVRAAVAAIPFLVSTPRAAAPARPAPAVDAPGWFLKMDRNGDGDVSLREFLGPIELFRKLDRDGDGLISPAEARAGGR